MTNFLVLPLVFLATWLTWALIPRQTSFSYYYFAPSLLLTLSLSFLLSRWRYGRRGMIALILGSLVVFVWCWPVLVGEPLYREQIQDLLWFVRGYTL